MESTYDRLYIYRLRGSFYFPWHRHQIRGDSSENILAKLGKGHGQSFNAASVGLESANTRSSVVRSNHRVTAPHDMLIMKRSSNQRNKYNLTPRRSMCDRPWVYHMIAHVINSLLTSLAFPEHAILHCAMNASGNLLWFYMLMCFIKTPLCLTSVTLNGKWIAHNSNGSM